MNTVDSWCASDINLFEPGILPSIVYLNRHREQVRREQGSSWPGLRKVTLKEEAPSQICAITSFNPENTTQLTVASEIGKKKAD